MTRAVDPSFGGVEKLWRRIERKAVRKDGTLRPSAFRLQVSVVRERYGSRGDVPVGKWNGVAEATVVTLSSIGFGDAKVACVDEPLSEVEGHALVAVIMDPDKAAPPDVRNAVRQAFAHTFKVVVDPT